MCASNVQLVHPPKSGDVRSAFLFVVHTASAVDASQEFTGFCVKGPNVVLKSRLLKSSKKMKLPVAAMLIVYTVVPKHPLVSTAVIAKLKPPVVVGVPERAPVLGSKVSPGGAVPPLTE